MKFYRESFRRMGLIDGLKSGESILDYMDNSQIDRIWNTYDKALQLIDVIDDAICSRTEQTPIRNPYKYVITIAEDRAWPLLPKENGRMLANIKKSGSDNHQLSTSQTL